MSSLFNYIVGNPPYQNDIGLTGDNSSLAKQLFPSFIQESVKIANNGTALITPARWFAGDAQDKSFLKLREFLKENNHISAIVYYPNEKDVFRGVEIKGGVCYFIYKSDYSGDVKFSVIEDGKEISTLRPLFEEGIDIVMTNTNDVNVLAKIKNVTKEYLTQITTGRNAFGIIGKEDVVNSISKASKYPGCCELRLKNDIIRYIDESVVAKNQTLFNSYKVYVSKSAGAPNKDEKVIGRAYIGHPKSACTDSLITIGCFNNEEEALNLQKYLETKFLRYMVRIVKSSQNVTQIVYKYVPLQDFTSSSDIDWSKSIHEIDQQLYAKYGLSEDEINFIETHVKEMT